jgi:hypothetical protein
MTKKQISTQALLKSISVNITAYIKSWSYHADLSEQHTKAGPGRKHKRGIIEYIPADPDTKLSWKIRHVRRSLRQAFQEA